MFPSLHRDQVFIAGGQPTVTYVKREELHIERQLARAIATPNQIVSLSGPTKTGKTVLCRRVLGDREYVWIDGGQIDTAETFWGRVSRELRLPLESETTTETETAAEVGISAAIVTAGGSRLTRRSVSEVARLETMAEAIDLMTSRNIFLVIDDFHYLDKEVRMVLMRNVKGAIFNGMKVILLSVTHRTFDAIKAESELTGRFAAISLPVWSLPDLMQIPVLGFDELKTDYGNMLTHTLASEAQESPFLMQRFCWEICFDSEIERAPLLSRNRISSTYNLEEMFVRIAKDADLPIYQRLVTGPQSRKVRTKRPLKTGDEADIYEATLLALAETGPKASVAYEELRDSMNGLLCR